MGTKMSEALNSDIYDDHVTKRHEFEDDEACFCEDCGEAFDQFAECRPCKLQESLDRADYNENIVDNVND